MHVGVADAAVLHVELDVLGARHVPLDGELGEGGLPGGLPPRLRAVHPGWGGRVPCTDHQQAPGAIKGTWEYALLSPPNITPQFTALLWLLYIR